MRYSIRSSEDTYDVGSYRVDIALSVISVCSKLINAAILILFFYMAVNVSERFTSFTQVNDVCLAKSNDAACDTRPLTEVDVTVEQ